MQSDSGLGTQRASILKDALIALSIGVGLPCAPVLLLLWLVTAGACLTTPLQRFSNVAGFTFDVSYKNCDLIAKEEWIAVLVSRGRFTHKTLLLEYVPSRHELPVIAAVGANSVRISVARISSLSFRRDQWQQLSIKYDFGVIDYPEDNSDPNAEASQPK
jgi:hypothetical protein